MRSFFAAFAVSTLVASVLMPLVRRLALRLGAVDHPGGRRIHLRSIPRFGGLAICLAFFVPLGALYLVESSVAAVFRHDTVKVAGLFAGGVVMCAVGAIDDTRGLRALYKLYAQIAVATVAFLCGFRIEGVSLPLLGEFSMGVFALPVTVLWMVGIINAVNLIDGLDGLAGGVVFFAGVTNFVVAYLAGSTFVALVMAALLGSVLGFLFHNSNPARIFMGDSGSYFLGFVLGATSLVGASQKASTAVALLVPVLALGVPIFDTLFAMVRRFLERRPIFSPDRGHVHHRLLDMGITQHRAVLIIYGVSVLFTAGAIGISLGRNFQVGVAILAASIALLGVVRFLRYFEQLHERRRQKARLRSSDVHRLRRLIPGLPMRFARADTESELLDALAAVASEAGMSSVSVVTTLPDGGAEETAFRWTNPLQPDSGDDDRVSVLCPIGPDDLACTQLRFGWRGEANEALSDLEILLQVVADIAKVHLTRLESRLAPPSLTEQEITGERLRTDAPATARTAQLRR
jgi:UDP-GlcNAc:undecaprenyl-phosphate GlcNAc-1-phosphate transferase